MHLTFWQPIPSFHQEGLLNALAAAPWVDSVALRYEREIPEEAHAGGWPEPHWEGVDARPIAPGERPADAPHQVHFFTGFHTHPMVWRSFDLLPKERRSRCFALTEAPALFGWRRWPRILKYRLLAKKLGPQLDGLLAIGGKAEPFYRNLLPPSVPVVPFAYYDLPESAFPELRPSSPSKLVRLLYVGRLIYLKGLDRLLRALAALPEDAPRWQLTLLGSGPEKESLLALSRRLGIADQLEWTPTVPAAQVGQFYQESDCLLQPSRGDGWGMTVIEGLRHGCEVIVTDACGAAVAAHPDQRLGPDWRTWTPVLEQSIRLGPLSLEARRHNQQRAKAYTAENGVAHLRDILSGSRCAGGR